MTHTGLYEATDMVLEHEQYQVKEMRLTHEKLLMLWKKVSEYRTLFSDLTYADAGNFMAFITAQHSIWLEIYDANELCGVICLVRLERIIEADAHVIFFDKDMTNKVPLCKEIVKWAFKKLPLQRMTVEVPHFYYATKRLVVEIGFKQEGTKRDAVLIRGKWASVYQYGILRREVEAL